MNTLLFDPAEARTGLLPLTFTRPVAELRIGIITIRQKWERDLGHAVDCLCATPELQALWPLPELTDDTLYIAGNLLPDAALTAAIANLPEGTALTAPDGTLLAYRGDELRQDADYAVRLVHEAPYEAVANPTDLFRGNGRELRADFAKITAGRVSAKPGPAVNVIGDPALLFIEEGATVIGCTINTTNGPVYIGREAEIMEGCTVRGPMALCDHAHLNLATRVWPDTTIGPWCKVGGELNNVIFHAYSNKAHDGFLGNSYVGEWCNLGADTVASNLKNDYSPVKLWSYANGGGFVDTGLQFCGPIIGDHSKTGINTMLNTGTVIGPGCNIFGAGFPRTYLPAFTFGGPQGMKRQSLERMLDGARRMMARRHRDLTPEAEALYRSIYDAETQNS